MSSSKVLLGVVVGIAAGAAIGILMAPDSGANTRRKISKKGQEYADDMKSRFNDFLDGVMEHIETAKDDARSMASDLADKAKAKFSDVKSEVKRPTNPMS
jgi:gas vesicle protein